MNQLCLTILLCQISLILSQTPDPDIGRTTCEIVIARGFSCEIHYVTTNQNYIIELHRVVSPSPDPNKNPVILQTGLIGTSADFIFASDTVSTDPNVVGQNMGLELAKQGYDVWLSNNRGSIYGLQHTTLNPNSAAFWRFSFDEISKYDTPAIIDFVLSATEKAKLHFIGHSQGAAVMLALLSKTQLYNDKVQSFIAIAPTTQIGAATTSFRFLIAALKPVLLAGGAVFTTNPLTSTLLPLSCGAPIVNAFCQGVFFSITGPNYGQMDLSRLPVYLAHMPTSTSAKNLLHYDQLFNSNRFQMYDYGPFLNPFLYGSLIPPIYPLTSITHTYMTVIYANNDWFVPSDDSLSGVETLRQNLPVATEFYEISDPFANHMDPLIGITDAVEVNNKVIDVLSQSPV